MATDFIEGSATFTNGDNVVTAVTLTQNTLSGVAEGVIVKVSSDPVIDNVEAVKALAVDSFQLRNNWPHATGTYTFMMNFSPEAIKGAARAYQTGLDALNAATDSFGSAATKDAVTSSTDTTADRVLLVGADEDQFSTETKATIEAARGASTGTLSALQSGDANDYDKNGNYYLSNTSLNTPSGDYTYLLPLAGDSTSNSAQIAANLNDDTLSYRRQRSNVWLPYIQLWTTGNTTVDSSGFIKEASPIVKLFNNDAIFNELCPKTAEFEKIGTGNYLIKGTLGFAQKGWWIETPKDTNGNVKFYTEWEQLADNTIEIKTFDPDYSTGKCTGSVPMDITTDRWIDLRLEPEVVDTGEETE